MTQQELQKLENIIKDYGLEDGKPSEEVLSEMQTIIDKNKIDTTPQELAILDGRLRMRNLVTKEVQSAIKEAEKHTSPSRDTIRMYGELKSDYRELREELKKQGQDHVSVHNTLFEKVDKIGDKIEEIIKLQAEISITTKSTEQQAIKTNGRTTKSEGRIDLLEKSDIRMENSIKNIENTLEDVKKYFDEKKRKEEEKVEKWANGWKSLFFDLLKYIAIGLISGIPTAITAVIYLINVVK